LEKLISTTPLEGLSLLLPIHNQATAVERGVSAWNNFLTQSRREFEIIVIDDGSTDLTSGLFEDRDNKKGLRSRFPTLQVITHPTSKGYGACLRSGLAVARFPLLAYTSLDEPYNPADLKPLIQRLYEVDPDTGRSLDLVNGHRAGRAFPRWRRFLNHAGQIAQRVALGMHPMPRHGYLGESAHRYAFWLRWMFGLRLGDVNSCFKLFRKSIFDRIPIQSDGDFVHAEILAKANFLGCLMDELPIGMKQNRSTPPAAGRRREMWRVFFSPDFGGVGVALRDAR